MAVSVEHQRGELTGSNLNIGAKGHGDLLVVPFHDINGEFNDLLFIEVPVKICAKVGIDEARLGHDRVGITQGDFVPFIEITRFVAAHLVDGWFIETLLLGDRQAHTQSSVAVVIHRTSHAHQFGRDRIKMVTANHSGLPLRQGLVQLRCGDDVGRDSSSALGHELLSRTAWSARAMRWRCSTTSNPATKSASP